MQPFWIPDELTIARSNIQATLDRRSLASYDQLYKWSVAEPDAFWEHVVETLGIRFHQAPERTLDTENNAMSFCWFPGAQLNIAESCFQAELDEPAIVHGGPAGGLHTMNLGGIKVGAAEIERVVAELPHVEEVAAIAVSPPEGGPSRLILCVGTGRAAPIDRERLLAEMQQAIKTKLSPLFKVDELLVMKQLPRTASGKIIRRQLRTQSEKRQR